jgi:hypothetical protein
LKVLSGITIERLKLEKPLLLKLWNTGFLILLSLATISCGGSSSSSGGSSTPANNPVPSITSLSPSSIQEGNPSITLTVTGSGFVSGSVIKWNGSSQTTVYVSGVQLRTTINASDIAGAGTASVTVYNPPPGGGTTTASTFIITSVSPLSIVTTVLPNASHNKNYNYLLQVGGGIPPYTWSVINGSLPNGLSLSTGGVISGTPPSVASDTTATFAVQVQDASSLSHTSIQSLSILVRSGGLGRNDSCPTTTSAISNGTIRASISPYGDIDVYSFQGTAGNKITAQIYAQRLQLYQGSTSVDNFMDSFLELLDSNCNRLTYNDDISSSIRDSRIANYTLPYTGVYYLRISDIRGDGRPDFIYELDLFGAN